VELGRPAAGSLPVAPELHRKPSTMKASRSPAVSVVIALLAAAAGVCSAVDAPVPRAAAATASLAAPSRDFDFGIDAGRNDSTAMANKRQP
jgi:hypothetical protein